MLYESDQTNEYGLSILDGMLYVIWVWPDQWVWSLYIGWYVICYMRVTRPMSMVSLYWMVCYMLYGCDQTNEYGLSILDGMLYAMWYIFSMEPLHDIYTICSGSRGRDRMLVGFTNTYAFSAYHHYSCEFESRSWRSVFDTTLCDKVCQWLAWGRWFSSGTPVSSNNTTDRHEILLKVALHHFQILMLWQKVTCVLLLIYTYIVLIKFYFRIKNKFVNNWCFTGNDAHHLGRWHHYEHTCSF
jgi:hypothetical protein